MYVTRCPKCQTNVDVVNDDTAWIRCVSCGFKIRLRESDEERERRQKREKVERRPKVKVEPINYLVEMLPILVAVPMGLFCVLPSCLMPQLVIGSCFIGMVISTIGFVKACTLAGKEGYYIGFDYLESLGTARFAIMFFFFGIYVQIYLLLWYVAQISCTINRPKVFLPWIGLQVYGGFIVILAIIVGAVGAGMGMNLDIPNPAHVRPVGNNRPNHAFDRDF